MNGVTVSQVRRNSHDDNGGSVTIGLASRRPSRIPYAMNVLGCRRCAIHNLSSTPCTRLPSATIQANGDHIALLIETRVSDFIGVPSPSFQISNQSNYLGFPVEVAFPRWLLTFKQSSFHHSIQLLPSSLAYPTSAVLGFPVRLCVPLGFPLISGKTGEFVDFW